VKGEATALSVRAQRCQSHYFSATPRITSAVVVKRHLYIPLSITNKMQRYTILFITVNAVHVSGRFPAHHQELKNCTHSIGYMSSLLAAPVSVGELELTHASGRSKQAWHTPDAVCTVFELLMMSGETA